MNRKAETFLYVVMLICFMCPKAIGLTEGQWPFEFALIIGFCVFGVKLLVTEYSLYEWGMNLFLLVAGGYVFWHNGHLEVLVASTMLIGMKGMDKQRVIKTISYIWIPLFSIMVVQAVLGGYQGWVARAGKEGRDNFYLRYSLGYTHPNVLHMTYLLICMLLIALIKVRGKKLIILSSLLMLGNLYIFAYSVSMTGIITVTFLICLNCYLGMRKKNYMLEKVVLYIGTVCIIVSPIVVPPLLRGKWIDIFRILTNRRFPYLQEIYKYFPPTLFGTSVNNISVATAGLNEYEMGFNVDSSFAYIWLYHGCILFGLFVVGFAMALLFANQDREKEEISIFAAAALAGTQEQFLGNLSMKNILWIYIGDAFYNRLHVIIAEKCETSELYRRWIKEVAIFGALSKKIILLIEERNLMLKHWNVKKMKFEVFWNRENRRRILITASIVFAITLIVYSSLGKISSFMYAFFEESGSAFENALKIEKMRAYLSCLVLSILASFGGWYFFAYVRYVSSNKVEE